jgi:Cu(I)/Ag(I) efflux system membrane fusion protein
MVLLAGGIVLDSCQSKQPTKQQETGAYYTCPMHHQIHEDKPGNCPICGMKLIKVASSGKTDKMPLDSALSYLTEPVTQTVVGSFKVIEPVITQQEDTLTVDGYIGFDQRDINMVNTRVAGRIENLYVRYTNQRIHKGQPLMKIYSPELLSVQRNLLQVMQDKDQTLINSLKAQLINLGMQATEIQRVMQSGQALSSITIINFHLFGGFIIKGFCLINIAAFLFPTLPVCSVSHSIYHNIPFASSSDHSRPSVFHKYLRYFH